MNRKYPVKKDPIDLRDKIFSSSQFRRVSHLPNVVTVNEDAGANPS